MPDEITLPELEERRLKGPKARDQDPASRSPSEAENAERGRLLDLQAQTDGTLDQRVEAARLADMHLDGLWRALAEMRACTPRSPEMIGLHDVLNPPVRNSRQLITAFLMNAGVIEPMDPADAQALSDQRFLKWEMARIQEARALVDQLVPPPNGK